MEKKKREKICFITKDLLGLQVVELLSLIRWREAETSGNNIWRVHLGVEEVEWWWLSTGQIGGKSDTVWKRWYSERATRSWEASIKLDRTVETIFDFSSPIFFLLLLVAALISQHHHSAPLLYPKKWSMATTFRNGDESTEILSSCVIKGCVCCLCFSSLFQVGYKYTHGRESQKTSMPLLPLLDEG